MKCVLVENAKGTGGKRDMIQTSKIETSLKKEIVATKE
jgi:hypothetical protein